MSGPASVQPDPDKERDRSITWRVAMVGLVGVLLAGMIGGGSAYLTAQAQSHSQAKTDQASFLRQQKQVAYSKFVADTRAALDHVADCFGATVALTAVAASNAAMATSASQLDVDAGNIELIGSAEAVDAAIRSADTIGFAQVMCSRLMGEENLTPSSQSDLASTRGSLGTASNNAGNARAAFVTAAREDLRSG